MLFEDLPFEGGLLCCYSDHIKLGIIMHNTLLTVRLCDAQKCRCRMWKFTLMYHSFIGLSTEEFNYAITLLFW